MSKSKKFYKEIYPHVWNQYKLLYDMKRGFEHRFQILLAFTGIIILILFNLNLLQLSNLFIIPLIGFLIVIFISICHITPRRFYVPWTEQTDLKNFKNSEEFYKYSVNDIYEVVPYIRAYEKSQKNFIMTSINLIIISVFLSLVIYLSLLKEILQLIISTIIFIGISVFLNYKYEKEYFKRENSVKKKQ